MTTALTQVRESPVPLEQVKAHLVDDFDAAGDLMRWLSTRTEVAFDTETTGLSKVFDRPRLAQFGWTNEGFAVPVERWSGLIADVFDRFEGTWVAHNLTFDASMVRHLGVEVPRHRSHDTRLQTHTLDTAGRLALERIAERLVDSRAGALQARLHEAFQRGNYTWETVPYTFEPYWSYACMDTILTSRIHEIQYPQVMAEAPRAYELELGVAWVCDAMERRGVPVDRDYVQRLCAQLTEYVAAVGAWCQEHYDLYPGSSSRVIEALQRDGVEFTKFTERGAISLDKEVLGGIDHPLAKAVLGRRQSERIVGTYLETYLELSERDGLIHPSINTVGGTNKNPFDPGGDRGVRTGRMSCSDPNLQNVPVRTPMGRRIRNSFTARPEHAWVRADFSQIEMRGMAHLANDVKMIEAFRGDGDFFVNVGRELFAEPNFQKSDSRRDLIKNGCVPFDTEILTQRGWLKHNEVMIGDQTLGFDPVTRVSRWTTVTAVHHYHDAPVVRFGNKHRSFVTTPNHRWRTLDRHNRLGWALTEDVNTESRILLAAPASVGEKVITDVEARVLGWLLTDGSIKRGKFVGATSQGANGHKVACQARIYQSKSDMINVIDDLLVGVPHRRSSCETRPGVVWNIDPTWARSLLDRMKIDDKHAYDAWQVALQLTPEQRQLMLDSMWQANAGATGLPEDAQTELTIALGYLTGKFSRVYLRDPDDIGWQRRTCANIHLQHPYLTGVRTKLEPLPNADVWCVTTELGTWTMRQGRTPVLTGNSYAIIYGAGIDKFAKTAGVTIDVATRFMRSFDQQFPDVAAWTRQVINEARQHLNAEGIAYARSELTNRRYVAKPRKEYALINYLIQGMAGELFKMKVCQLDAAGLGPYLMLPVHDEVDLEVPDADLPDVLATLRDIMNDDQMLRVPIEAEISTGARWGDCK